MNDNKTIKYLLAGVLIAAPVILIILICISPLRLIYDENNFVSNIPLLERCGLSVEFIRGIRNQSPGPLYQFIYTPLKAIGITTIVQYRLVNMLMLLGSTFLLYKMMKEENVENPIIKSMLIFAIPGTWTTGGLALTEIPSILFLLLSVYALFMSAKEHRNSFLLMSVSGLLMSLTIIGRTPFLMVLPAAACLFFLQKDRNIPAILSYFLLAMAAPLAVFYIWKGLVPPHVQTIQSGIKPLFLTYAFSYLCVFVLIINPTWYKLPVVYYKALGALFILLLVLNVTVLHINFVPLKSLSTKLPAGPGYFVDHILSYAVPCLMWCMCALHIVATVLHISEDRNNAWKIFLLFAATFIAITTIKSAAQFSTRYPYQSFPFLLLYCAKDIKLNKWLLIRAVVGIVLGIVSLRSYYSIMYHEVTERKLKAKSQNIKVNPEYSAFTVVHSTECPLSIGG